MQQYRMLRNNKESGPYSWQDLIDMPLKAYDLIWVEGKSASWRYPSEIEELKAHAPAVQEDFYAQFHTPAKVAGASTPNTATLTAKSVRKTDEKKFVAVILPQTAKEKEQAALAAKKTEPVQVKKELHPEPAIVATVPATEAFVQPVQQVKKAPKKETIIPTEKILAEDSSLSLPEPVAYQPNNSRYWIATAFLLILAAGIYLGTRQPSTTTTGSAGRDATGGQVNLVSNPEPAANELQAEADDDIPRLQPNAKLDFASLKRHISVSTDHYDAGFFGGISNLRLTVKNNSSRPVQKLVIAIDYLNSDKSLHHTENIVINQLAPNGKTAVDVPDSRNGVAFQTRVIGINGLSNP